MNFIPEQTQTSLDVPFFEDATSKDGWQGQATTKNIDRLKAEIVQAITRLGGTVTHFQRGRFQTEQRAREGFRIHYVIDAPGGGLLSGRIDVAALPVKDDWRARQSLEKRTQQSLRMALYMLRTALDGTWCLQQLSPGYAPLMPWMLADGEKTVTQLWQESPAMQNLLPPGEGEFVEGVYNG